MTATSGWTRASLLLPAMTFSISRAALPGKAARKTGMARACPDQAPLLRSVARPYTLQVACMYLKKFLILLCLLWTPQLAAAAGIGNAIEQFGDSVLGGLENLGQTLNEANSSLLGDQPNPPSFEAQMRAYRQQEEAKVQEMATVTGVKPEVIRDMRASGMTWEQIASKYGVNLNTLPLPPGPAN